MTHIKLTYIPRLERSEPGVLGTPPGKEGSYKGSPKRSRKADLPSYDRAFFPGGFPSGKKAQMITSEANQRFLLVVVRPTVGLPSRGLTGRAYALKPPSS